MRLIAERIEAIVIARAGTATVALTVGELVKPLARFAPGELTPVAWRDQLAQVADELRGREVLDDAYRVRATDALAQRIGPTNAKTWAQLADRVLPGLGLGLDADDSKAHGKLVGRDAWAAAIAGRALGLWQQGAPPSLAQLCDALAWRELGLAGKPKRCPPEVRAVFVQRQLRSEAGPPERLVRLLAAREVGAPRPELRVLRDALVRGWLGGRTLGPALDDDDDDDGDDDALYDVSDEFPPVAAPDEPPFVPARWPAVSADAAPLHPFGGDDDPLGLHTSDDRPRRTFTGDDGSPGTFTGDDPPPFAGDAPPASTFARDVKRAAAAVRDGRFGDRKVFVSAVWDELRQEPRWATLALDDFKARLFAAHGAGELTLARADLVAAMDPALVAASEIEVSGASFHFVVQEPST